jgi:hypothetical protein
VAQFIIQHASFLRVCVHTANLIESDWKYKTQGAYLQDFPRKTDPAASASAFEEEVRPQLGAHRPMRLCFTRVYWLQPPSSPGGGGQRQQLLRTQRQRTEARRSAES